MPTKYSSGTRREVQMARQNLWRWCYKCQGLCYSGNADQGPCPAGGSHDGARSAQYGVNWEFGRLNQIVLTSGFIAFSGGVPVGGWANVSVFPDGSYKFNVHFHDSGFTDYNVSVLWVLRSSIGQVFTFAASGHMCGTVPFCTHSRYFDSNPQGTTPPSAHAWDDLSVHYTYHCTAKANQ